MSVSGALFSEGLCYMETSQFICIVYQLAGYYVIGAFTEKVSERTFTFFLLTYT